MPKLSFSTRFAKDVRKWKRSGRSMQPFEEFLQIVRNTWPPPARYEAHLLQGEFAGIWDVHLRQNWVLLLRFHEGTLEFRRMGTHAELGL